MLLFRMKPDADPVSSETMLSELASFPSRFPAMRNFALGRNASKRDDRFTYAMTIEFDTWADLDSYLSSAEHERFVTEKFRPLIEERAIASIEDGPAPRR